MTEQTDPRLRRGPDGEIGSFRMHFTIPVEQLDRPREPRAAVLRRELPGAVSKAAEIVVDNPMSTALALSGAIVGARVLDRLIKPQTPLMALAGGLVTYAVLGYCMREAIDRGIVDFRLRDGNGGYRKLSDMGSPGSAQDATDRGDPAS